ncbi:hypothetical protein ACLH0K_08985 [Arthrobacter sp. MPF02]|uniref:hypothetical protein n=1 Tax=Arthrobacter sp. MPF02 TaxID=3388492 RepID=UPI00398555C7
MKDALPDDIQVSEAVNLELKDKPFPDTGADIVFDLDEPIPETETAVVAHWNEDLDEWDPVATSLSEDRKQLSAHVEHFSMYGVLKLGEDAYNLVGRALGNLTTPPHCYGEEPSWSETIFTDDQNGPVLWCVGRDVGGSEILEVKVVMNRPVVGVVKTGIKPKEVKSDVLGNVSADLPAQVLGAVTTLSVSGSNNYLIQPHGQYRFLFEKNELYAHWRDDSSVPLIEVGTSAGGAIAGLVYEVASETMGDKFAYAFTEAAIVECLQGGLNQLEQVDASAFSAATTCLSGSLDVTERLAKDASLKLGLDPLSKSQEKTFVKLGKNLRHILKVLTVVKLGMSSTGFGLDRALDPGATRLMFFPTDVKAALADLQTRVLPDVGPDEALIGTWRGPVYGFQDGYDLVLTVTAAGGKLAATVDYPQLQCSGTWTEKKREPGSITFREVITADAQRRCVRELDAVLKRTESGPRISIRSQVGGWIYADLVKQ